MSDLQFEVETTEYVPVEKVNPFTDVVKAHIAESGKNPNIARTITVDVNAASKAQLFYQKAANAEGKTAKLKVKDESAVKPGKPDPETGDPTYTGKVKLTFVIGARQKARRGEKSETAITEAEAPAEAPAAE